MNYDDVMDGTGRNFFALYLGFKTAISLVSLIMKILQAITVIFIVW